MSFPTHLQGSVFPENRVPTGSSYFPSTANISNINFNAPVIRLSTSAPFKSFATVRNTVDDKDGADQANGLYKRNFGLGNDQRSENYRFQQREQFAQALPPSKEEVARTIYIGNVPREISDESLFTIFRAAGSLRRCIRALDASNNPCGFGFAEYEDAESLGTAAVIFQDLQLPSVAKPSDNPITCNVSVDSRSLNYVEEWRRRRGDDDDTTIQSRVNAGKQTLQNVLQQLEASSLRNIEKSASADDNITQQDELSAEVITIPLGNEDDLTDIPAEMREIVTAEIAAFRERSLQRDAQKLARHEAKGPAKGSDDIGYHKAQNSSNLQRIALGSNKSPPTNLSVNPRKDDMLQAGSRSNTKFRPDNDVNDDEDYDTEEFEHKTDLWEQTESEKLFIDTERRWLNREAGRAAAIEREKNRDKSESEKNENERRVIGTKCEKWNDDVESERGFEEFYRDRNSWIRRRNILREQEIENDNNERRVQGREHSERLPKSENSNHPRGPRQSNANTATESNHQYEAPKFTLSLGAAAQKVHSSSTRKMIAEVEGLLDNEENGSHISRRTLVPIESNQTSDSANETEERTAEAIRRLAGEIPIEKSDVWSWNISWDHLEDTVINDKLKPFVEKKIVEYVGVQEQLLVDVILENVRNRSTPDHILSVLEGALDEEAELLINKLWRMIIFYTESEKRGISH